MQFQCLIMRHILKPFRLIKLTLLLFTPALMAGSISPYLAAEFDLKLTNTSEIHLSQQSYRPEQIQFNQLQFDLTDKHISITSSIDENANNPVTQAQSFKLTNWDNEYLPLLNNVPLNINGKSLALSISDDETHFILASDKETVLFSSTGQRLWHHLETSTTISTLISVDRKYVISLFSNGVLRWLNYADGTPLFSLYISPETRNWIIWSPQGYYDTSSPFFNPLRFDTTTSGSHSLSQLRDILFSPENIALTLSAENRPTSEILNKGPVFPEVSLKIKDEQRVDLCIKTMASSPHDAMFTVNGVTTSRSEANPVKENSRPDCQFEAQAKLSPQQTINNISVSAVSKASSTRSLPVTQSVEFRSSLPSSSRTAILIPHYSAKKKLPKLLNSEQRIQPPISQALQKLNNTTYDAFILYLAADCNVIDNDIELLSADGLNNIRLSQLSFVLQNVNIINSLIAIDCTITSDTVNTLATKRLIYNFIADTGRTTIAQFITKQQLKLAPKKQTILESVIIDALQGEADLDDDLSIYSTELLDYINQNLPLKNFELTGDKGNFYIYKDLRNKFELPLTKQVL